FQPVPNLVMLAADRAMTAAQDADDPRAMAAAAWYVNHVHRDAGEAEEVRVQLAHDTARLLDPERDRAEYGLLYLAIALSHAKVGREGDAWRAWDVAEQAARGVEHPWLKFGPGMVHAYQVTMLADLQKPGEAVRRADALDFAALGSMTRRAFHTIETARAFYAQREYVAAVALLRRANEIAPETTRHNLFARFAVTELANSGGATVRDDAERLATALGVTACRVRPVPADKGGGIVPACYPNRGHAEYMSWKLGGGVGAAHGGEAVVTGLDGRMVRSAR